MHKRRIDRFLNDALSSFAKWLQANQWRGKEHDCVNLFVHKFIFEQIAPGAAIECPTQVSIECAVKQPERYANKAARKDLVIWERPLQNTWSEDWEPIFLPKVVMEWKVFRARLPKSIFDQHDEEWITSYTVDNPGRIGYIVSVDFSSSDPKIYWKKSKSGLFSRAKCA